MGCTHSSSRVAVAGSSDSVPGDLILNIEIRTQLPGGQTGDVAYSAKLQFQRGGEFERGGLGMNPDHPAAVRCYLSASELGNVDAQFKLGNLYSNRDANGQLGVQQDFVEAVKW